MTGKDQNKMLQPAFPAWKAPLLSFYCSNFYRCVACSWKGTGMLYLLGLVSLSWFVTVFLTVIVPVVKLETDDSVSGFFQQMPKVLVSDGHLSLRQSNQSNPPLIVRQDTVIFRIPGFSEEVNVGPLVALCPNIELDPGEAFAGLRKFLPLLPVIFLLVGTPIVYFLHLVQMFFYGFVAFAIALVSRKPLSFPSSLRLAAIAMTPAIVVSTGIVISCVFLVPVRLLHLLIVYAPLHGWLLHHPFAVISVLSAVGYLVFGIRSLSAKAEKSDLPAGQTSSS